MNTNRSLVKRYPLVTFYILAYGISWGLMLLWFRNLETLPWFTFGPMAAALMTAALASGKVEVRDLLRRQFRWRVGWVWYVVALGLPVFLEIASIYLNVLFGASAPDWSQIHVGPDLVVRFLAFAALSGPLGEELGWRGYALPRLQARRSALTATLIVGVLHVAWHLPMFAVGEIDASGFLATFAGAFVSTWVFNRTNGSVLLTVLLHAANQNSGRFLNALFSGADAVQQDWLKLAVWSLAAISLVVMTGRNLGRNPEARAEIVSAGQPTALS